MAAIWAIRTHIIEQNLNLADLAQQLNMEMLLLQAWLAGDAYLPEATIKVMARMLWDDSVQYDAASDTLYSNKAYTGAVTTSLSGKKKPLIRYAGQEPPQKPAGRPKGNPLKDKKRPNR